MGFLFSMAVDEKNADLAGLAVVGAVGDMQDETGKLIGLNQWILEKGIRAGVLGKKIDLRLYGRISRPLVQFLAFASNPVLPELTANEENCARFLQGIGIDLKRGEEWVSYEMLSTEQKKKLSSALIVHLHEWKVPEWKIKEMIGEVYSLLRENPRTPLHDAKEFGTLLNSCGRHGWAETGLAVCLGNREEAYAQALSLLVQHRKQLREGIQFMKEKGVEEKKFFYFVDAEESIPDSIVGIVAGMLYGSGQIGFQKPILAFARYPDGSIKASGRGTRELVKNGLNLGMAFREICSELGEGNEGGGHAVAAGVKLETKNKELFLELLEKKLAEQLQNSKTN
jgi:RecJ-like exonuclease